MKEKEIHPEYEVSPIMHHIEIDNEVLQNQLAHNNNPYRMEILRKVRGKNRDMEKDIEKDMGIEENRDFENIVNEVLIKLPESRGSVYQYQVRELNEQELQKEWDKVRKRGKELAKDYKRNIREIQSIAKKLMEIEQVVKEKEYKQFKRRL